MALTGLLLLGFVIGHLGGNLLIFLGPDALNDYAKHLRDLGPGLWAARTVLSAALIAHILTAICLTLENRKARPVGYVHRPDMETTYAARTMMASGFLVLAYIVYHLLHFTFRTTNPAISHLTDKMGRHDVYSMVVLSFQNAPISIVYVLAMFLLCLHLKHGIASIFQTLGLNNEHCIPVAKRIGFILATLIFLGYIVIPLAVLFGGIRPLGAS